MQDTIVLYPYPTIGHIVSMVELGKLILHRHDKKFSIIILTTSSFDTPSTTSYINHINDTYPSISFHCFPPLPINTEATPPHSPIAAAFKSVRLNAENVFHSLQEISKTSRICGFVIDLFCTSALPLARDLGISTYYFFTSGAADLSAFMYFPTIHQQHTESFKDLTNTMLEFPGLPCIKAIHMAEPILDRNDPAYDDMLYFCSHLPKSDGIIVNTFEDLEQSGVKSLQEGLCCPGVQIPPIYYIGPLISRGNNRTKKKADIAEQDYLSWLDAQPKKSVVFLCFGSRGSFSVEQVHEIAYGLERSGYRFLWVLKNPTSDKNMQTKVTVEFELNDVLPEGFLDRTQNRGMVVKSWATQVKVLNNDSVGAFVTHCGWNSVLEAVVAGIPMVAWPLYAEQHMNKVFLVEDMKMAIPVEQIEDGIVTADELEKSLTELMESENCRELRERSWKMRDLALAAQSESGSSTRDLAKLVYAWKKS